MTYSKTRHNVITLADYVLRCTARDYYVLGCSKCESIDNIIEQKDKISERAWKFERKMIDLRFCLLLLNLVNCFEVMKECLKVNQKTLIINYKYHEKRIKFSTLLLNRTRPKIVPNRLFFYLASGYTHQIRGDQALIEHSQDKKPRY